MFSITGSHSILKPLSHRKKVRTNALARLRGKLKVFTADFAHGSTSRQPKMSLKLYVAYGRKNEAFVKFIASDTK